MSDTKFTPGPWKLYEAEYPDKGGYTPPRVFSEAVPDAPKIVCELAVRDGATEEANGLMIAAAPDMYEALKVVRADLQFLPPDDVVEQIDAALAKADGKDVRP